AAVRIDHPFLAPGGGELDAVVVHGGHLEPQPPVERPARDELLHALRRDLFGHRNSFVWCSAPCFLKGSEPIVPSPACGGGSGRGPSEVSCIAALVSGTVKYLLVERSTLVASAPSPPSPASGGGSRRPCPAGERESSRRHDHLAEDLAVLDQAQALGRLFE